MSSKTLQPLYTTVPWNPTDFYSKGKAQVDAVANSYPISPDHEYHARTQPYTDNTFTTPFQADTLISPATPLCNPPASTPETFAYPAHQYQITHSQYPTTHIRSPWSSSETSQQLLTPQYQFFPSNLFTFPQPQPLQSFADQAQQNAKGYDYEHVTQPYPNSHPFPINTQQNATDDLFQNDKTALEYSTTTTSDISTFGIDQPLSTIHHHDIFQPQHEATLAPPFDTDGQNKSISDYNQRHSISHSFRPRVFDHSDANSIIIDNNHNRKHKINIFRSDPTLQSPKAAEPITTIDPKLSSWGNMAMSGERSCHAPSISGTIDYLGHDRISVIPTPPTTLVPGQGNGDHHHTYAPSNDDKASPTKRTKWSSAKTTTPLRKRRPPQLHLPPPSTHMRVPITTSHSAPAASFSLDLFVSPPSQGHGPGRRNDTAMVLPQEPPKIDGWVSPEERPVPPVGYVVPGFESAPKIFDYESNPNHIPLAVEHQPSLEVLVDTSNDTSAPTDPGQALPPMFQQYQSQAIPPAMSQPQLRVPNIAPNPAPTPFILVPGLNGFEVVPWRPKPDTSSAISTNDKLPMPPTTAAPWEVSTAPPLEPSLPPSTASSSESISTFEDHLPIPSKEVEPIVNNDQRGRGKSKARQGVYPPPRCSNPNPNPNPPPRSPTTKQHSVICEICDAFISRASDLPRHMRKHTGEKPYQCQYCDCSYARNDKLSNHIIKNHPGQPRTVHRTKFEVQP